MQTTFVAAVQPSEIHENGNRAFVVVVAHNNREVHCCILRRADGSKIVALSAIYLSGARVTGKAVSKIEALALEAVS